MFSNNGASSSSPIIRYKGFFHLVPDLAHFPGGLFLVAGGRDMEVVFAAQGRTSTSA